LFHSEEDAPACFALAKYVFRLIRHRGSAAKIKRGGVMKKLFLGNESSGSPARRLPNWLVGGLRTTAVLIGASAIATSLTAPAAAADMAMPVKASAPPIVWDWTEFYFGVHIGYAQGGTSWCTTVVAACAADTISQNPYGYAAGGQFGYRWQVNNFVIGAEYQLDGMAINQTSTSAADPTGTRYSAFNNLQSLTGQAGIAFDRTLFYGKGGWALTRVNFDATDAIGGAAMDLSTPQWKWVDGWTAGGGLEYMLWTHVSIGVEYDYYRFNIGNYTNLATNTGAVVACAFCGFNKSYVQTITARLNVKLWPWGP
jgi:outer membrane immunogenic protein